MTARSRRLATATAIAAAALFVGSGAASAACNGGFSSAPFIPYSNCGVQNTSTYSFTAMATGQVDAYFADVTQASFAEQVELVVNGTPTGVFGLPNHSTSPGTEFTMGNVTKGDTLGFILQVYKSGTIGNGPANYVYSDPSLNLVSNGGGDSAGNGQHVYSTSYTQGTGLNAAIPSGTYVAFEDAPVPGSDLNYHDETYVFTNVGETMHNGVPEPASLALLGTGLIGLVALRRRA